MISASDSRRRVVVTGMGIVSPIGCTISAFWNALVQSVSGIDLLHPGSPDNRICAGVLKDFQGTIENFGELEPQLKKAIRKALKLMNRETQIALAAAEQALRESKLATSGISPERIGVCFGANNVSMMPEDFLGGIAKCTDEQGRFDMARWGQDGLGELAPLWLLKCLPNMPACYISIFHDFQGPNNSITERDASANLAVAEAWHLIQDGDADVMITGATGTNLLPMNRLHMKLDTQIAESLEQPQKLSRPFDRDRCGSVIAEGAACLVLEELQSALERGARIYAEITGVGSSCVAEGASGGDIRLSLQNAMDSALENAGLEPKEIGHVHAQGMSTHREDIAESLAIRDVFGKRADTLPVIAAKSQTGNAGAGSGAMELVASILALHHRTLFPVLNCENLDPECPIQPVRNLTETKASSFLNLNAVSHGQASCLLVQGLE